LGIRPRPSGLHGVPPCPAFVGRHAKPKALRQGADTWRCGIEGRGPPQGNDGGKAAIDAAKGPCVCAGSAMVRTAASGDIGVGLPAGKLAEEAALTTGIFQRIALLVDV
jgi:hypothetical protein